MSKPAVLLAELVAIEGHESQVAELLQGFREQVLDEPGSMLFEVTQVREKPRHFLVFERYRDDTAFSEHLASGHGAAFNRQVAEHLEGGRSELTLLEALGEP